MTAYIYSDDSEVEDDREFAQESNIPQVAATDPLELARRFSTSSLPSLSAAPTGRRSSYAAACDRSENRTFRDDDDEHGDSSDGSENDSSPRIVYQEFESEGEVHV